MTLTAADLKRPQMRPRAERVRRVVGDVRQCYAGVYAAKARRRVVPSFSRRPMARPRGAGRPAARRRTRGCRDPGADDPAGRPAPPLSSWDGRP